MWGPKWTCTRLPALWKGLGFREGFLGKETARYTPSVQKIVQETEKQSKEIWSSHKLTRGIYSGMPCSNTFSILCNNTSSISLTLPSDYSLEPSPTPSSIHWKHVRCITINQLTSQHLVGEFFHINRDVSSCLVVVSFPWLVSNLQEGSWSCPHVLMWSPQWALGIK